MDLHEIKQTLRKHRTTRQKIIPVQGRVETIYDAYGVETEKNVLETCEQMFGVQLYLRKINGEQLGIYQNSSYRINDLRFRKGSSEMNASVVQTNTDLRLLLICFSLCTEAGERIYEDNEIDEIAEFMGDDLDHVYEQALDHNHLREDSLEQAEKNSVMTPT